MSFKFLYNKTKEGKSLRDLSSSEEKKILKKAAIGANKLQKDLVAKYYRLKTSDSVSH